MANITPQNWRYAVWHPVWICDANNEHAVFSTCTDWLQFLIDNQQTTASFFQSGHGWSSTAFTYDTGAVVEWGDNNGPLGPGYAWRSLQDSNLGNDPKTSPDWWEDLGEFGLGSENDTFTGNSGYAKPTRMQNGLVTYHLYTSASGVNILRTIDQYAGSHFSIVLAPQTGTPCVRMSATGDNGYYAVVVPPDEYGWFTVTIYKVVNGTETQIATSGMYDEGWDFQRIRIYATGDTIGVDLPIIGTGPGYPTNSEPFSVGASWHTVLETTDSSLSASSYPYIGIRRNANAAGEYLCHEWGGGGFVGSSPSASVSSSPSSSASSSVSSSPSSSPSPSSSVSSSPSESPSASESSSPSSSPSPSSSVSSSPSESPSSSPSPSSSVSSSPSASESPSPSASESSSPSSSPSPSSSVSASPSASESASPSASESTSPSSSVSASPSESPSSSESSSPSPSAPTSTNFIYIKTMQPAQLYHLDGTEVKIYTLTGNKQN